MLIYFADKLAALRRQQGLSQKELGNLLNVSNRAVSKWESGIAMPSIENIMRLATIFRVTMEELLAPPSPDTEEKSAEQQGMPSLRELYRMGRGPSSSHTIGPENAAKIFRKRYPEADRFHVVLFGSLSKTGPGHGTPDVLKKTLAPLPCTIEYDYVTDELPHPNTMTLYAYRGDTLLAQQRVFSVGGGAIWFENEPRHTGARVYELQSFNDIKTYCEQRDMRLWEYVYTREGSDFKAYLAEVWTAMKAAIHAGLHAEGTLPGGLDVQRKARHLYHLQHIDETPETRENRLISAYAFAVSEQNACGEPIVTAPTCGAAGVLPAVLYYQQKKHEFSDEQIYRALAVAGLMGNLIKTNASISGAECGCQAEVGSACAMAAAALGELFRLSADKIEYAAEIAIEHHLGLTCDPIAGLVQIPCIERNAVAAMRAMNAVNLSTFLSDTRKISFDKVVVTMRETGRDICGRYKETSEGGLAKLRHEIGVGTKSV